MAVGDGAGSTVTFTTSSFSAKILTVGGPGPTIAAIPTTHIASTGGHSYIASTLVEGGELSLSVQHDPTITVPLTGVIETVTIDWGGLGSNYSFSAFCISYEPNAVIDELMTADMTWKVTGVITGL